MSEEITKPWERQERESAEAFSAFRCYRDIPTNRSYAKVADKEGKSQQLIERWGAKYNWQERIRQYDNALDREYFEQSKHDIREMRKRHKSTINALMNKLIPNINTIQPGDISKQDTYKFAVMLMQADRLAHGDTVAMSGALELNSTVKVDNDPTEGIRALLLSPEATAAAARILELAGSSKDDSGRNS